MPYDALCCIRCGSTLAIRAQACVCTHCSASYPLVDGIPIFGEDDDIRRWTEYHKNELAADGAYAKSEPLPASDYYGKFFPDHAQRLLDVGGGDGNTTAAWAKAHPRSLVYIMDLSMHGLAKANRRGIAHMLPVCAAADRRFPFPNQYFDVVSTVFMVEHLLPDALDRFYQEAHRVLRADGLLVVASDTRFYDAVVHPVERWIRSGVFRRNDPTHCNLMTPIECERHILRHGFRLRDRVIHWIGGRHRWVRALQSLLPRRTREAYCSTMYVLIFQK